MASRSVFPLRGVYKMPGIVFVCGSFVDGGAGNEPSNIIGEGFSVERLGVGQYTITLDETFPFLVSAVCDAHDDTPTGNMTCYLDGGSSLITGAITSLVIRIKVNGSDDDESGRVISFMLALANSSIAKNRSS